MHPMKTFPHLLAPIHIGGCTLRNRVVMGSMHTGLEDNFFSLDKMAAYLAERAAGEVGLIVTGGVAPNISGMVAPFSSKLTTSFEARKHRIVPKRIHEAGGHVLMQILHAGRYAYHPLAAAPSAIKSPISMFKPRALSTRGVERSITDFVTCSALAQDAGYDGVEIMGSEGYFINQFIAQRTNKRRDRFGGTYTNRIALPVEIIQRVRERCGPHFIIMYRLSMLDLVEDGSTWDEAVQLAQAVERAGASIINTGIGWHEARVPTIATMVPRAGFSWVTRKMMGLVHIPLVATNRINTPQIAEEIIARGDADLVSMARPLLADPQFVKKAREGIADEINTCIACNQACLDHIFVGKKATCMVNPRAAREREMPIVRTRKRKRIAVVGAGPAGLAFAHNAAQRGHDIVVYDAEPEIGGQFLLAKQIPGKEEFTETLRYFSRKLAKHHVELRLGNVVSAGDLSEQGYDAVVLATGVTPRLPQIEGINHPSVLSYVDVLRLHKPVGKRVAIIGAGGIGFDTAVFLTAPKSKGTELDRFVREWHIDLKNTERGGIDRGEYKQSAPRTVYLLQRKASKMGQELGKTTGWIHRATLKDRGVEMLAGVDYKRISDDGMLIQIDGKERLLEVDNVVVCAGQLSRRDLQKDVEGLGLRTHIIGGAAFTEKLDAKLAIDQGTRLGLEI